MNAECRCGSPVEDAYLCTGCTRVLRDKIRSAPMWADQLLVVLARLTRYTDGVGRNNDPSPLPINVAAIKPGATLDRALRRCAAAMGAPEHVQRHRLGIVAAWLAGHVHVLRKMPTAVTWADTLTHAIDSAMRTSDRPPERWYAGRCACGIDLYPLVTETIVKCPNDLHTWDVETRRRELLRGVRDIEARGPDIARALTQIGTDEVTPERLRKWRHKGVLHAVRVDPGPPAANVYRVGDVLDLVARDAARRRRNA